MSESNAQIKRLGKQLELLSDIYQHQILRHNFLLEMVEQAEWHVYCLNTCDIVSRRVFFPNEWRDGDMERWQRIFSDELRYKGNATMRTIDISFWKRETWGKTRETHQYTDYYSQLESFLNAMGQLLRELKQDPQTRYDLQPVRRIIPPAPPRQRAIQPTPPPTDCVNASPPPKKPGETAAPDPAGVTPPPAQTTAEPKEPEQTSEAPEVPQTETANATPPIDATPEAAPHAKPEPGPQTSPESDRTSQASTEPEPELAPIPPSAPTDPRMVEAIEAAQEWIDWLDERTPALRQMNEDELRDKLRTWHRWLDYHVWLGVFEEDSPLFDAWCSFVDSSVDRGELARLGREIETRQRHARSVLSARNVERIEATSGSAYLSGVVERSDRESEPCESPDLDDRVHRIKAGEGGYRLDGRVLIPTRAIPYKYRGA